jgi:hypothetical protein
VLTHQEFGRLRLAEFAPKKQIRTLADWEFLGRLWIGEAIGFSEWLRPHERPTMLESLALDVAELPQEVVDRVLARLGLPLRKGLTRRELVKLLGEPYEAHVFADDRKTFEFRSEETDPYLISCTVLNDGGLTYLVVTADAGPEP